MKNKVDIRGVYIYKIGKRGGLDIWLVDGSKIRRDIYPDFLFGGHDERYGFVPPKEIWIDDDVSVDEFDFTLEHEIYERRLMTGGMSYENAHEKASGLERDLRLKAQKEVLKRVKNLKSRPAVAYD